MLNTNGMFTGIIRHIGHVAHHDIKPSESILTITTPISASLHEGDSVAVNGTCLTVLEQSDTTWTARLMAETLAKTNLGQLTKDSAVNLELPLNAAQGFDGHFVTGHVDASAEVIDITPRGNDKIFTIKPPQELMRYLVPKGTVALDGVSLTVVDVTGDTFTVSLMPYTIEHTIFANVTPGYHTNIETDLLAKHVVKLLEHQQLRNVHAK